MTLTWDEIVAFCIFAGVAASTYGVLALFDPYWLRVRGRVRELQSHDGQGAAAPVGAAPAWRFPGRALVLRITDKETMDQAQLLRRLARAGIYHPAAPMRFLGARLIMIAAPPLACLVISVAWGLNLERTLLIGSFLGGVGALLPGLWLDRAAGRRHMKFRASLPDFLDLMVVCLEGGMSLQETIRRVSDELRLAHPELAVELSIVQRDVELGATVDQALKRFALRTDYEGVKTLSTFIRESQRFGTNITEALRSHSDGLRSQREQAAEECAQKASVKILLPTMLLIFPAIFVVLVGPAAVQIYQAFGTK